MKDIYHFLPGQAGYPEVFNQLTDPPMEIFVRGQIDLLAGGDLVGAGQRPVVAVVGTRRADASGRQLARSVGRLLAGAGCTVVSGLALGVDAEAHAGALEAGVDSPGADVGHTVAVLGSGLADPTITPQQHLGLAQRILEHQGTLLSEYPPTYPAGKYTYPARNRLIAALCTHLVVIQAPIGSGALITVDHALTLGRSIASFPGPAFNQSWRGSNQLLKDGAEVLCEPSDVLAWLGINQQASLPLPPAAGGLEEIVLKTLQTGAYTTQELIKLTQSSAAEVTRILGTAELKNQVSIVSGKWILAGRRS